MVQKRLYFIDWLRTLVILSLIPYHAALTYTGLGEIYIKKPVSGMNMVPFIFTTMPLDNFFMTLLFFVSGISTYYSMNSRNGKAFISERANKLLKPFILGTLLLCPIQAYSMALYNGYDNSLISFLGEFFSKRIVEYLGYAHLWFLIYLFVFSLLAYPLFKWCLQHKTVIFRFVDRLVSKEFIFVPVIWVIAIEAILRPYYPGMQILIFDWANDLVYLSVYIFGFIFALDLRIQDRIDKLFGTSILMVSISFVVLFSIYFYWLVVGGNAFIVTRIWAIFKGIYEMFLIILLMVAGRRYFNKSNRVLDYLKKSSFTYYLYHLLVVTYVTLAVINIEINDYLKYLITVILSFIVVAIIHGILSIFKIYIKIKI